MRQGILAQAVLPEVVLSDMPDDGLLAQAAGSSTERHMNLWRILNYRRWLEYTPRGDSLDSIQQRITVNKLLLFSFTNPAWWFFGHGPRSMEKQIMRWASKIGPNNLPLGQPHSDWLHFLFEYGPPGVVALTLLAIRVVPRLEFGDPWSACVVSGAILSAASIPMRYVGTGLIWLLAVSVVYWR